MLDATQINEERNKEFNNNFNFIKFNKFLLCNINKNRYVYITLKNQNHINSDKFMDIIDDDTKCIINELYVNQIVSYLRSCSFIVKFCDYGNIIRISL